MSANGVHEEQTSILEGTGRSSPALRPLSQQEPMLKIWDQTILSPLPSSVNAPGYLKDLPLIGTHEETPASIFGHNDSPSMALRFQEPTPSAWHQANPSLLLDFVNLPIITWYEVDTDSPVDYLHGTTSPIGTNHCPTIQEQMREQDDLPQNATPLEQTYICDWKAVLITSPLVVSIICNAIEMSNTYPQRHTNAHSSDVRENSTGLITWRYTAEMFMTQIIDEYDATLDPSICHQSLWLLCLGMSARYREWYYIHCVLCE
ncbi:hypothetical protein N7520_003795 [Penicillium odoratum]|uniref:uncharacterized protein n=1 Tax=Penicillium odoratum TaxID=1167516 RepID=UPI002546F71D|nr:uncharacterized protein N7520_003795 [Penicillium odoratum]KAJ5769236.1 hypothetical protein N7520_003795 [Penicillium odoratum]